MARSSFDPSSGPSFLLSSLQTRLLSAGVGEARLKAELLLADATGVRRLELAERLRLGDAPAVDPELIEDRVRRLERHEPLQYVLGHVDFHGRRFRCDRRALIPRPETEELVEFVIRDPRVAAMRKPLIVDACTGTGCIAISLALETGCEARGTDLSEEALALARENAVLLGTEGRVEFRRADLLEGEPAGSVDVVVSNPPYIDSAELSALPPEVRMHEPLMALDGGPGGLRVFERLVGQAFHVLRPGGMLFAEIGAGQHDRAKGIAAAAGFLEARCLTDMAGVPRVLAGVKRS